MTTSTQPAISFQKRIKLVDENGEATREGVLFLELLAYHLNKVNESAQEYTALDPGTATTSDIATALNMFMASVIAT